MDKMVPIRAISFIWIPLLIIYFLPNPWWGISLKIILGLWILSSIKGYFSDFWKDDYPELGAFVVFSTLWFSCLLWIRSINWLTWLFAILLSIAILTEFSLINKRLKMPIEIKKKEGEDGTTKPKN